MPPLLPTKVTQPTSQRRASNTRLTSSWLNRDTSSSSPEAVRYGGASQHNAQQSKEVRLLHQPSLHQVTNVLPDIHPGSTAQALCRTASPHCCTAFRLQEGLKS
jgi:hypothetical protein